MPNQPERTLTVHSTFTARFSQKYEMSHEDDPYGGMYEYDAITENNTHTNNNGKVVNTLNILLHKVADAIYLDMVSYGNECLGTNISLAKTDAEFSKLVKLEKSTTSSIPFKYSPRAKTDKLPKYLREDNHVINVSMCLTVKNFEQYGLMYDTIENMILNYFTTRMNCIFHEIAIPYEYYRSYKFISHVFALIPRDKDTVLFEIEK